MTKRRNSLGQRVYCVCRGIDNGEMMIECDACQDWFHGSCVNITEPVAEFVCPKCKTTAAAPAAQPERSAPKAFKASKQDSLRKVCVQGFTNALAAFSDGDQTDKANRLEKELYEAFHDAQGPTAAYKSRYRSVLFNLKDPNNTALRDQLAAGLSFFDLVRLEAHELNPSLKAAKQKADIESLKQVFKPKMVEVSPKQQYDDYSIQDKSDPESPAKSVPAKSPVVPTPRPLVQAPNLDDLVAKISNQAVKMTPATVSPVDPLNKGVVSDLFDTDPTNGQSLDDLLSQIGPKRKADLPPPERKKQRPIKPLAVPRLVWQGQVSMPQVCSISTQALSDDPIDPIVWPLLLPTSLLVTGRIDRRKVLEYLFRVSKRMILVSTPTSDLYKYLVAKQRCAVVKVDTLHVKDFYLIPVPKQTRIKELGIDSTDDDRLFGVIVLQNNQDNLLIAARENLAKMESMYAPAVQESAAPTHPVIADPAASPNYPPFATAAYPPVFTPQTPVYAQPLPVMQNPAAHLNSQQTYYGLKQAAPNSAHTPNVLPPATGLMNAQGQLDSNLISGLLAQFLPRK